MKKFLTLSLLLATLSSRAAGVDLLSATVITNLIATKIAAATNITAILNSVERYGAVGDGATDDYAAITNGIRSTAEGANIGGTLLFGAKTYRIAQEIFMTNLHNLTLKGEGPNVTILKIDHSGATDTGLTLYSTTNLDGVTIQDMSIEGVNDSDTSPYDLIKIQDNWSNCRFTNLRFRKARHAGLRWTATTYGTNFLIDNCRFELINTTNMTALGGGMILGSPNNVTIRSSFFSLFGTNRSTMHAVYLTGCTNINIHGCFFNGTNARTHVYSGVSKLSGIVNNIYQDVVSITLDSCNGLLFNANTLNNSTIKFSCDNGLINGNSLVNGLIQVLGAGNQTISGNTFSNATGSAFTIDSSQAVMIRNNYIVSPSGIDINQGGGHILQGNFVVCTAESPVNLTGAVSNIFSLYNQYKLTAGPGSYILKNSGTGTNNLSAYDILATNNAYAIGVGWLTNNTISLNH